ncbi:hypothetical protein [Mycoplasmopsis gallinacea]|uniref:Uncharacterized protein n=1 Tax=Mycoplasmopsis gallinacea TaxID=29556 RepID=A0A449A2H7_9BACT|nr:hypothetical protein [Mycoplasmopsis gallinacea]VEU58402.1 Uncharacterised protein [Mycoplasmopsis gallinacea]
MNRTYLFETEETKTLYIYKAITKDNNPLTFQKNSVNVVALEYVKQIDALVLSKGTQPILDSSEALIKLSSAKTFSLQLNEHLNFDLNDFYFFSFEAPGSLDNNDLNNFYYIQEKNQMLELYQEEFEEISITQLKFLKELNDVDFIFIKNQEELESYKSAFHSSGEKTLNLNLRMPTLLNSISLYQSSNGRTERIKATHVQSGEEREKVKPFLFLVNPINVKNNSFEYYFWTLSNYKNLNARNLFLFRTGISRINMLNLLNLDNEAYEVVKNCCYVTYVLTSPNTENFNDDFKRTYTTDSNPTNYNNNQIQKIINKYEAAGNSGAVANFKAIIYSLSNHIKSDFNYGGGMKKGFTLTVPFYIQYSFASPSPIFTLMSDHFNIASNGVAGKFKQEFLNLNSFVYQGSQIQLPLVPNEFEEFDFSQNPLDFNEKSLNFNYPIWLFSTDDKIANFFNFKFQDWASDETVERTYEFSGRSTTPYSEIEARFIRDVGINYKVIGSTVVSTRTETHAQPKPPGFNITAYEHVFQPTTTIHETIKVVGRKIIDGEKFFQNITDFIFINKNDLNNSLSGLVSETPLVIQTEAVENLDTLAITSLYLDISQISINEFALPNIEQYKKRHNLNFKFW